jgi:hypothetical protein
VFQDYSVSYRVPFELENTSSVGFAALYRKPECVKNPEMRMFHDRASPSSYPTTESSAQDYSVSYKVSLELENTSSMWFLRDQLHWIGSLNACASSCENENIP